MLRTLLHGLVDTRPGELRALVWSFAYFFCLLTSYYILRPVRDEMGIQGGVENLQWLFTATFVVMLLAVPAFGVVVARLPRQRFVPWVYRFFSINIGIFYVLFVLGVETASVARAFFVWTSVFNLFVVSVFWSLMADFWKNEQGRRLFGFIAAGGSLGALLGPTISVSLSVPLGPVNLMLIAIIFLECSVYCVFRLNRARGTRQDDRHDRRPDDADTQAADDQSGGVGGGPFAGITAIMASPYLVGISLWVLLLTLSGTFLYLIQAHVLVGTFGDPGVRTQVFAAIDLVVAIATIAIQLVATGRIVKKFGVGVAAATLPSVAVVGFLAIFLSPLLITVVIFQAAQRTANFAMSNPAREILFTVLPREQKYKAKNVIDTVIFRGGDAVSSWIFAVLKNTGLDSTAIALLTVPVCIFWGGLGYGLGKAQERRAEDGEQGQ